MSRVCKSVLPDYTDNADYVLDNIGNRLSTTNNGDSTSYTANSLNQYSDIDGTNLTYDADGNMLTNGDWAYTWNGENRLISASNATQVLTFAYDYMGRRFEKSSGGDTTIFVYDGWNMIRESLSTETNHYAWGLDLFGTIEMAGGVGGLLSVIENDGEVYFPVADANGNVTGYIDDSGDVEAVYVFDAFGNIVNSSGAKKDDFKFRFSSKYEDETGLNYYGYRYYDAGLGRWLSRDPIGELGAVSVFYADNIHSYILLNRTHELLRLVAPDVSGVVDLLSRADVERAKRLQADLISVMKSSIIKLYPNSAWDGCSINSYVFAYNQSENVIDGDGRAAKKTYEEVLKELIEMYLEDLSDDVKDQLKSLLGGNLGDALVQSKKDCDAMCGFREGTKGWINKCEGCCGWVVFMKTPTSALKAKTALEACYIGCGFNIDPTK